MKGFDFTKVTSKVFLLLLEDPRCRDDDRILCCEVWKKELEKTPEIDFLKAFEDGIVSHPESIRRMRQKLQEKHEGLRGKRWLQRHKLAEVVCGQIAFL